MILSYSFFILSLFIVKSGSLIQASFFRNTDLARTSPCSDRRTSLAAAPESMQSEGSTESVSVHLQLNSKANSKDSETPLETVPDEEGLITVYEYVQKSSGSVVLAATSSPNALRDLEKFSVHVFGSNYSEMEDMQLEKVLLESCLRFIFYAFYCTCAFVFVIVCCSFKLFCIVSSTNDFVLIKLKYAHLIVVIVVVAFVITIIIIIISIDMRIQFA